MRLLLDTLGDSKLYVSSFPRVLLSVYCLLYFIHLYDINRHLTRIHFLFLWLSSAIMIDIVRVTVPFVEKNGLVSAILVALLYQFTKPIRIFLHSILNKIGEIASRNESRISAVEPICILLRTILCKIEETASQTPIAEQAGQDEINHDEEDPANILDSIEDLDSDNSLSSDDNEDSTDGDKEEGSVKSIDTLTPRGRFGNSLICQIGEIVYLGLYIIAALFVPKMWYKDYTEEGMWEDKVFESEDESEDDSENSSEDYSENDSEYDADEESVYEEEEREPYPEDGDPNPPPLYTPPPPYTEMVSIERPVARPPRVNPFANLDLRWNGNVTRPESNPP